MTSMIGNYTVPAFLWVMSDKLLYPHALCPPVHDQPVVRRAAMHRRPPVGMLKPEKS